MIKMFSIVRQPEHKEIIDILAMNINNENEILAYNQSSKSFEVLKYETFKDMILGEGGKEPNYKLYNHSK